MRNERRTPHAHGGGSKTGRRVFLAATLAALGFSCVTESNNTVETASVEQSATPYSGPMYGLAIGKLANTSPYGRGIFSDGQDRLGNQAKTILKTHLSQSGRFTMVDRDNMAELALESEISGAAPATVGAELVVTGEVTEFGRRVTGDKQLFGIAGRSKTQTAYAKVSLNVVDVATSRIVHSVQGAGEYHLSDREVLGTGGASGYDSTLNGKVLELSIRNAVDKLSAAVESGAVRPVRQ